MKEGGPVCQNKCDDKVRAGFQQQAETADAKTVAKTQQGLVVIS